MPEAAKTGILLGNTDGDGQKLSRRNDGLLLVQVSDRLICCPSGMSLFPELPCDRQRIEVESIPPGHLISRLVQLPVMTTAKRDRKLVAHLDAERARLGEAEMVGIAGVAPADDAGLGCNKTKV